MNTPSTHCSTPQKSPSSADGMGDDKHTLTPHEKVVLFKDQAGDLENAPTPPSPSQVVTLPLLMPQQLPALKKIALSP